MDECNILFSPTLSFVGVVVCLYISYRLGLKAQVELSNYQKQQKVFSQLMGVKFLITQFYVSRFEALIFSDYHEALWKLEGYPKESLQFHVHEAHRWMQKSEALVLDMAKNNQTLFEIIGSIRIVFNNTPTLEALTERIYHFKTPLINDPSTNATVPQLESWKKRSVKELQELVEDNYAKPIDNLLKHLASEMAQKPNWSLSIERLLNKWRP